MNEEIEKLKKEIYRYKTLCDILTEENKTLKEKNANLENQIAQLQLSNKNEEKKSFLYRGLRKIYHIIRRK